MPLLLCVLGVIGLPIVMLLDSLTICVFPEGLYFVDSRNFRCQFSYGWYFEGLDEGLCANPAGGVVNIFGGSSWPVFGSFSSGVEVYASLNGEES